MDRRETGFTVVAFGLMFFVAGAFLLMDRAMMIAGNILIIAGGVTLVHTHALGLLSFWKLQSVAIFGSGVFFLLKGYVFLGLLLELFGLSVMVVDRRPSLGSVPRVLFARAWRLLK